MRQCWSAVSTTYHMWGGLGLKEGFSDFTLLLQKSIILLTLPLCTVSFAKLFCPQLPLPAPLGVFLGKYLCISPLSFSV